MYKKVNRNKQFNFQINRVLTYHETACDEEKVCKKLKEVKDIEEWYDAWTELAVDAIKDNNQLHAAYYYRMAEFFLINNDSRKHDVSRRCIDCFVKGFMQNKIHYEKSSIPFENGYMKSFRFKCENPKEIIVVCGGYDSFIEEFVIQIYELNQKGYEIILFEGPGQGECVYQEMYYRYDFDKATSTVLDFYKIEECVFLGISWGGYFAIRSAAFEKRIKKVVAYDVLLDGYEVMTHFLPWFLRIKVNMYMKKEKRNELENLCQILSKKSIFAKWMFSQGKIITGTTNVYDMYKNIEKHVVKGIDQYVTQDVMILAGQKDHYIPRNQFYNAKKMFQNAKSLRLRMFTKKEGGEQHCQIGNHELAMKEIIDWL